MRAHVETKQKKALVTFCPYSGSFRRNEVRIEDVISYLKARNWSVTTCELDGAPFAPETIDGDTGLIVLVGGDGTIRDTIHGILESGSDATIALIPAGTCNMLAAHLGLCPPFTDRIEYALRVIDSGRIASIDVGCVNGTYFTVAVGNGPMAQAITTPNSEEKSTLGRLAWAVPLVSALFQQPIKYRIDFDERSIETIASGVFVSNVASPVVTEEARMEALQNGKLQLFVVSPTSFDQYLQFGYHMIEHFMLPSSPVELAYLVGSFPEIRVEALGPVAPHGAMGTFAPPEESEYELVTSIDGDRFDYTLLDIKAVPAALKVLAPWRDRG